MRIATARAVVCDGMRAIIANYVPSILTARAVDIADYQMFVGAYGNTPKEQSLPTHNRKAVANPDGMDNSRPVRTHFLGGTLVTRGCAALTPG